MDDVNKKTESLRQEFIVCKQWIKAWDKYSALLAENLKDLAKEHKAVCDEVQHYSMKLTVLPAQQGIDDS